MSKTLIYLFAIFALWLYFKYGNFDNSKKFANDHIMKTTTPNTFGTA